MPERKELVGSLAMFFASLYIVVLIPGLLPITPNTQSSIALTAMMCAASTAVFGLVTGLPYMIGPGIVPASLCLAFLAAGIPWPTVLGISVVAGSLFTLLALSGILSAAARQMPDELKLSVKFAIGYYLLIVAFRSGGLTPKDGTAHLAIVSIAFLTGLMATFILDSFSKLKDYAIIGGMFVGTVIALATGATHSPTAVFAVPSFVIGTGPDIKSALQVKYVVQILTMLYVLVVDVVVTIDVVSGELAKKGVEGVQSLHKRTLVMSGVVATLGPLMGFCPFVAFFETLAGVFSGSRTWRTPVIVALAFMAVVFLSPLAVVVPSAVSAIALAVIGLAISKSSWKYFVPDNNGGYDRVTRYLLYPALLGTMVFGSISIALFGAAATYPVAMRKTNRSPRASDWVVAAVCAVLLVLIVKVG